MNHVRKSIAMTVTTAIAVTAALGAAGRIGRSRRR